MRGKLSIGLSTAALVVAVLGAAREDSAAFRDRGALPVEEIGFRYV